MPTDIETIEDKIIAEVKRTEERVGYPVIGIQDCDTWSGDDIEAMLRTVLTPTAVRVIYAGGKHGEKRVIGSGTNHDKTMIFRLAVVVSNLKSPKDGSRGGYGYLDAIEKCFTQFALTPLEGYLWPVTDDLLLIKGGKYVYGFDFERRTT